MIVIGRINNHRAALAFVDYLKSQEIQAYVTQEDDYWHICLVYDHDMMQAKKELQQFLHNPNDEKYQQASWSHGDEEVKMPTAKSLFGFLFKSSLKLMWASAGQATKFFFITSLFFTVLTVFGEYKDIVAWFTFSNYRQGMPEIMAGQWYRLVTPIFLHFKFHHILFNMMWLWLLGNKIEKRNKTWIMFVMILYIGIIANISQYILAPAIFGGMSGVVYGLLGYVAVKQKLEPQLGYYLPQPIIIMMMAWLVICLLDIMPNVANAAHVTGLLAGIVLAGVTRFEKIH